jgi:RNA ligase
MTTTLSDIFDLDDFVAARDAGYVRVQSRPESTLSIANYSEKVQFERAWNPVTLACRGLIYDAFSLEVVARPFPKFFNFDDSTVGRIPSGPVLRMEKFDGSLGILYWVDNEPYIATRGSFTSEQAVHATRVLREMLSDVPVDFDRTKTYLFEIIAPWNRIVVDYGDLDVLVLLDVIDIATGYSDLAAFSELDWPLKADRQFLTSFVDTMQADIPEGHEGFVFLWPAQNLRVKMKSSTYVELHRIVTGLNERVVWEQLGHGRSVQQICEPLPDELHAWVQSVAARLLTEKTRIMEQAIVDFTRAMDELGVPFGERPSNRGEFARHISMEPNRSYLFSILDGKDFSEAVWKTLKPAGGRGPRAVDEDNA